MKQEEEIKGTEKEFIDRFKQLTETRSDWQVWPDVIEMIAITISNVFELDNDRKARREKIWKQCADRNGGQVKLIAEMMTVIVQAFEANPNQDFLGKLYMELGLGSHWKGQFFTPYNVSYTMAETSMNDAEKALKEESWISINDPACGAGSTLIAAANCLRSKKINYQTQALFIGNDIDPVTAQMCYIQLSLLGCPGYIVVANTLTDPVEGDPLFPKEKASQDFWYTPFWYRTEWAYRRILRTVQALEVRPKRYVFNFDFEKESIEAVRKEA